MADDVSEELEAVHFRHGQIDHDNIEFARVEQAQAFGAALRGQDFVMLLQYMRELAIHLAHCRVVIDEQDRI